MWSTAASSSVEICWPQMAQTGFASNSFCLSANEKQRGCLESSSRIASRRWRHKSKRFLTACWLLVERSMLSQNSALLVMRSMYASRMASRFRMTRFLSLLAKPNISTSYKDALNRFGSHPPFIWSAVPALKRLNAFGPSMDLIRVTLFLKAALILSAFSGDRFWLFLISSFRKLFMGVR